MDARACEVLVVGGGPAGLSAALVLARARHRVIVCDHGRPRNAASGGLHGYLTRDGILPGELLEIGRREALGYGVHIVAAEVTRITKRSAGFVAELDRGKPIACRLLLLATGVTDRIPDVPGIERLYGKSVHHCPFCDGWEWRDQALALYGKGQPAAGSALGLLAWSADVVVLTDGPARMTRARRAELERHGVRVFEQPIERLEGVDGMLQRVVFRSGGVLARDALFFSTGNQQACRIAVDLGCEIDAKGALRCDRQQRASVPGIYVAGDAARDVQFAIVAAAEGAKAAVSMHKDLVQEDLAAPRTSAAPTRSR